MYKRKIFVANMQCGMEISFELYEGGSVRIGGEPDDGYIEIGPSTTEDLTKDDVKELFVVFRELLKEAKK